MHQEPISSMIRKYLWQALKLFFFHLKALKTSYFAHQTSLALSRGAGLADRLSPVITSTAFSKKCPFDSQNIFFPPLPTTFKVMQLLPAVSDGHHKLCLHPLRLVDIWDGDTHTHIHTHKEKERDRFGLVGHI